MAETLTFLLRAAALPTEAIAPAVRLAAALSLDVVLSEEKAAAAANVRANVWDRIRPHLVELFEFSGGRVRLRPADDICGFELLALQTAAREKRKRPTKPSNDPRVHALIEIGMDEKKAKDFVGYATRTYGEPHFLAALEIAKARRPDDARSFMIRVIQNQIGAGASGQGVPGVVPKKVLRQIRVTNPEAGRSELLGWEAPTFDSLGVASYPTGQRRQVWRNRMGIAQPMAVGEGTVIPTPIEDPGVLIVESLR